MKRFLFTALVVTMLSLCILPYYAGAVSDETQDDYIYVTYEEFHGNRAHYDALLMQGYTICVSVGDEHADEEIARFTQPENTLHTLSPSSQTRGPSMPTEEDARDIHEIAPYHFECNAEYEMLYTNYRFYGCTAYLVNGFNADYSNKLRMRAYGTTSGTVDFSVPARSSIYKVFGTESEAKRFIMAFYAPSNAYGTINCVGH